MGAKRSSMPLASALSAPEQAAADRAAREKALEEDRLRREEEARRRGLRGSAALVGAGGLLGFDRGGLGTAGSLSGVT